MLIEQLALLPVLVVLGYDPRRDHLRHEQWDEEDGNFDNFKLTMIYPPAVCRADDDTVQDVCKIPLDVTPWTIHGLW